MKSSAFCFLISAFCLLLTAYCDLPYGGDQNEMANRYINYICSCAVSVRGPEGSSDGDERDAARARRPARFTRSARPAAISIFHLGSSYSGWPAQFSQQHFPLDGPHLRSDRQVPGAVRAGFW